MWTHWTTLRRHFCVLRAAASAASFQVNPILRILLEYTLVRVVTWPAWSSIKTRNLPVWCLLRCALQSVHPYQMAKQEWSVFCFVARFSSWVPRLLYLVFPQTPIMLLCQGNISIALLLVKRVDKIIDLVSRILSGYFIEVIRFAKKNFCCISNAHFSILFTTSISLHEM